MKNEITRIPKHIPVVMHNLSKEESHLFLRALVHDNGIFDAVEGFTLFYKTIETQYEMRFTPCYGFTVRHTFCKFS